MREQTRRRPLQQRRKAKFCRAQAEQAMAFGVQQTLRRRVEQAQPLAFVEHEHRAVQRRERLAEQVGGFLELESLALQALGQRIDVVDRVTEHAALHATQAVIALTQGFQQA